MNKTTKQEGFFPMEHTGKRALVLAGGGAKGSYQIGVWRALQELRAVGLLAEELRPAQLEPGAALPTRGDDVLREEAHARLLRDRAQEGALVVRQGQPWLAETRQRVRVVLVNGSHAGRPGENAPAAA